MNEIIKPSKNYFDLTKNEMAQIKADAISRSSGHNPFQYYLNNCLSCIDSDPTFGSFVCNLVYWIELEIDFKMDTDVVGWYANESFYHESFYGEEVGVKTNTKVKKLLLNYIAPVGSRVKERLIEKL